MIAKVLAVALGLGSVSVYGFSPLVKSGPAALEGPVTLTAVPWEAEGSTVAGPLAIGIMETRVLSGNCGGCSYCLGGHDMDAGGDEAYHGCLNTNCQSHPKCEEEGGGGTLPGTGGFAEVWQVYLGGDADALRRVVEQNYRRYAINEERGALQIESCGQLVANLPLTTEQIERFTD